MSEKIKKGKCRKKKEEKISKLTIKPINLFFFLFGERTEHKGSPLVELFVEGGAGVQSS